MTGGRRGSVPTLLPSAEARPAARVRAPHGRGPAVRPPPPRALEDEVVPECGNPGRRPDSDCSWSPRSVTGAERWPTGRWTARTAPDGPWFEAGCGVDRVDHFRGLDGI